MVFCNEWDDDSWNQNWLCHNPYFNRWFSAITNVAFTDYSMNIVTILILIDGFLQLKNSGLLIHYQVSHNPYFNRWFSAILFIGVELPTYEKSQSLF